MGKIQYPANSEFELEDLIRVGSGGDELVVKLFGLYSYKGNLEEMGRDYSCLPDYPQITFTPATTEQSILVASANFENRFKRQIFNRACLQAGVLVTTDYHVFSNPPKDECGNYITDETELMAKVGDTEEFDGVFFNEEGLGYCLTSSFKKGEQSSETFARGGLARLLEGTRESVAGKLGSMSSADYPLGVNVDYSIIDGRQSILKVACLSSCWVANRGFGVYGGSFGKGGHAFGVLK